ncbi:NAD(P)/FAD-dependent oxidoreductase [Amycolatopsis sp. WQ 127309]|uniref:flavin-containing monooxygenase n=1 Tax=Amycolatopsis sp. WQ 127309 TaxID=2932773 RepID=UPI001FF3C4D4|nr:NAD(P)/FAD-dependent oxidoreductase [Amycolatopsis sp. WQ 127309]UOZ06028.1 NAD(P)/FAD-dependent oxidoreductase [Amycolatopsis sp. WQ 127309]
MERADLRARYRSERDKRVRSDGTDQYLEPVGRFAHFTADPHTSRTERDPIVDDVEVVIIGGGFAGLVTGARLVEAGVTDIRIVEGGGGLGGVWYWNRYPGAMCDTAAMVYLPLLEETGHVPSAKYVQAPEILAHARRIADTFGLNDGALCATVVQELIWDEVRSRWLVRTDRGDELRARFVTLGTGPLHRPKLPGIPGIETFAGQCFHTSRWDYGYTGGDPDGAPLTGLADKRVGIIGTGATAVQCIPRLARDAGSLSVFQRTPSSVDVRGNHPIDPDWFASLKPGWQREWLMNFATLQGGGFAGEDLVKDGWTDIAIRIRDRIVAGGGTPTPETFRQAYEDADDEKMDEIRARIDAMVADPAAAEALKPWYRQLCKRPCFHDEYLDAYNRPGVQLIDTDGQGVERIDATGAWAGGKHYPLDCLILASGFEFGTSYERRAGFDPVGRGGVALSQAWSEGMVSLHGIHVHGFPNMFVVQTGQAANLISNVTHNLVEAGTTTAAVIAHAHATGAREVETTATAQAAWIDQLLDPTMSLIYDPDCTPGYYNNEGRPLQRRERLNQSRYPAGSAEYFRYIEKWRDSARFDGLDFRPDTDAKEV